MNTPIAEVAKVFQFEAAHWLPRVPPDHKDHRVHGHSYSVTIRVRGPVDSLSGYVCDFSAIKAAFAPVDELLDHRCLNDVPGLENPTSETLAIWTWDRMVGVLPGLYEIEVRETSSSSCIFRGEISGAPGYSRSDDES